MYDQQSISHWQNKAHALQARWQPALINSQLEQLQTATSSPDFWQSATAKDVMQQIDRLQQQLQQNQQLTDLLSELETITFLLNEEGETADYQAQLDSTLKRLITLVTNLELEEYLDGPYDQNDAIFSIHAGQGGTEAMDWAQMLARAYTRYYERKHWHYQLISQSRGEEAGIKAISYEVKGRYVYGLLKHEAGTHRLVRLSPFNADNLRQTSFALVEVLPIIPSTDQNIQISDSDLSWHFSRAGGAGGQNVNKVNTAVELTYLPLGLTVRCREERSQEQNKQRALQILRAKLALLKEQQQAAELSALKGDNTQASWGTQIRNYVLHPYQQVKDVRTKVETSDTAGVLDGDFDKFINAALAQL